MKIIVKKAWKIVRPFAIGAAFYLIFRNVNIQNVQDAIKQVQWPFVVLYLFMSLALIVFQGVRWWVLIHSFTDKLSFRSSMAIHFSSIFYSIILPNSTAQEVIRTVNASKMTGSVIGWSSAWISKIMGICVSFGFSIMGLLLIPHVVFPSTVYYVITGMFFVMCFSLILSFSKFITKRVRLFVSRIFPNVSLFRLNNLREGIYQFRDKKKGLILSFASTIFAQMLLLGAVTILLYSITGKTFLFEVIAFVPLIEMISMAQPLTPGGIGVREALMALMFKQLNLSGENLAIYVILSNLTIALKLLGGIPLLWNYAKKTAHT